MRPGERRAWTERLGEVKVVAAEDVRAGLCNTRRRAKMGNHFVITDGRRFDSKLEADRYLELKALKLAGHVQYFLRQVPFELTYRVKYRVDFQVFWTRPQVCVPEEGCALTTVTYEDTKGFLTETARVKLRLVRELYGVHVRLLRRADVKRMRT